MKNGSEATEIQFYQRILILSWTEKKEDVLKTIGATEKCLQHITKDVPEKLITARIEGKRSKENSE